MIDFGEYVAFVLQTLAPAADESQRDGQIFASMGMASEAGEIAEIIRKHYYQGEPWTAENYDRLMKELGDAIWFWTLCVVKSGFTPEQVIARNFAKLKVRYPEGHFSVERSVNREDDKE